MRGRIDTLRRLAACAAIVQPAVLVTGLLLAEHRLGVLGRADLKESGAAAYLIAIISAAVVGAILIARRPENAVGWCFAGLGSSLALAGFLTAYAAVATVAAPGSLPAGSLVAVLSDAAFIPWFVLIAAVLHLTPTGKPLSRAWARAMWVTIGSGVLWLLAKLVSDIPLDPPFDGVRNPMAVDLVVPLVRWLAPIAGVVTALGVLVSAASLLWRFHRARDIERQQLHWLALVVVPLPLLLSLSFLGAATHNSLLVTLSTGTLLALVPLATGFAIARYQLYDVDRILSRAVTYTLLSTLVVMAYVVVVLSSGVILEAVTSEHRPAVTATIAALAAVAVAAPVRRRLQNAVDRRFARRRFDAIALVKEHVRQPSQDVMVEGVLRDALGDAGLEIAYWIGPRDRWVTATGHPAPRNLPYVEVSRHGAPVARVYVSSEQADLRLVEEAAREALPDLVSSGLRAALALDLVEVSESRARIAAAQLEERRRIERDLHDGAQQRMLALAMQLRAAVMNGSPARLVEAAQLGAEQAQEAVRELRALANGLHPAVLTDGGLAAAVEDLAARLTDTIALASDVPEGRYPPGVEATAWFIMCESVANAVKHSGGASVLVTAHRDGEWLRVRVVDDGHGGADPQGSGLRGLADRAAAVGGWLTVGSDDKGTRVTAELPCVS